MEKWEQEFEWLRVRTELKEKLGMEKLPDLNAVLVLIGVQELGHQPPMPLSKEHKQDLMHVAVCTLLEPKGIFVAEGEDEEGWPHFKQVKAIAEKGEKEQESLLIDCVIDYFKKMEFIN